MNVLERVFRRASGPRPFLNPYGRLVATLQEIQTRGDAGYYQLVREVFAVPLVDAVSQLHDAGSASLSLEDALRVVLLAHDQHLLTEHIVARLRCVDWTAVLARLSMDTSTGRALLLRLLRFLHLLAVPNVCSVSLLFSNTIHKCLLSGESTSVVFALQLLNTQAGTQLRDLEVATQFVPRLLALLASETSDRIKTMTLRLLAQFGVEQQDIDAVLSPTGHAASKTTRLLFARCSSREPANLTEAVLQRRAFTTDMAAPVDVALNVGGLDTLVALHYLQGQTAYVFDIDSIGPFVAGCRDPALVAAALRLAGRVARADACAAMMRQSLERLTRLYSRNAQLTMQLVAPVIEAAILQEDHAVLVECISLLPAFVRDRELPVPSEVFASRGFWEAAESVVCSLTDRTLPLQRVVAVSAMHQQSALSETTRTLLREACVILLDRYRFNCEADCTPFEVECWGMDKM